MKLYNRLGLMLIIFYAASFSVAAQTTYKKLVWADEFTYSGFLIQHAGAMTKDEVVR